RPHAALVETSLHSNWSCQMSKSADVAITPPVLTSGDIIAGLGAAPRELLATSLALFDDGTLQARIRALWDRWKPEQTGEAGHEAEAVAAALQVTVRRWKESTLTDDD